jgi:hypothetical protein
MRHLAAEILRGGIPKIPNGKRKISLIENKRKNLVHPDPDGDCSGVGEEDLRLGITRHSVLYYIWFLPKDGAFQDRELGNPVSL